MALTSGYLEKVNSSASQPDGIWSQSTTADFNADTSANVYIANNSASLRPVGVNEVTGCITNPSFEQGATGWTSASSGKQFGELSTTASYPMPTDGTQYFNFYSSYFYSVNAGDYYQISQSVNLTGISIISFDAALGAQSTWNTSVRIDVLIDGTQLWTQTAAAYYPSQTINVSGYPGVHTLTIRQTATGSFSSAYTEADVDNFRTFANSVGTSGSLTSTLISPGPNATWGAFTLNSNAATAGTALAVNVLDAAGNLLAPNVASGTDLGTIAAVANASAIRLQASLSTTNANTTPTLNGWSVTYYQAGGGAWSNVVSSTQGIAAAMASAPLAATTSVGTSFSYQFIAAGSPVPVFSLGSGSLPPGLTLSGTGGISGIPTGPGTYRSTILANNGQGSASSQTFSITVTGTYAQWSTNLFGSSAAAGDRMATPQNDGVANLLKFYFDINPTVAMTSSDRTALPEVSVDTTTTPGHYYLSLQYRQSAAASGLNCAVQISSDLQNWQTVTPGITQQVGTDAATGDPIIKVEVDVTGQPQAFLRLQITDPTAQTSLPGPN